MGVEHYSLDMIVSIGYWVKSYRSVEFRQWANKVLKQYILQGYDHQSLKKPKGNKATYRITYEDCRNMVKNGAKIIVQRVEFSSNFQYNWMKTKLWTKGELYSSI